VKIVDIGFGFTLAENCGIKGLIFDTICDNQNRCLHEKLCKLYKGTASEKP
jgi:hypothetical protein